MKFLAIAAALVSVVPALAQDKLTVNTISGIVNVVQPIQFTWSGGQAPYFLSLIPAGQPSAAAIKQFDTQQGTSFTWNVDLPAGSTFSISLKDSLGTQAFSDIETVNSGPDSACLTASASVSETGSSGSVATSAGGASSAPAASTSGSTAASSGASSAGSSASRTASTTASASATAQNNGALAVAANTFGIAGLMGLVGAALF
ncbi:hypothetical protein QCA50_005873 [Cerrena zonata]|uniref:Uncharacterized protein n=1 Tax=Cerrena zonata TaxID=2478898 RepID=A0AAW0GMB2_9APHY